MASFCSEFRRTESRSQYLEVVDDIDVNKCVSKRVHERVYEWTYMYESVYRIVNVCVYKRVNERTHMCVPQSVDNNYLFRKKDYLPMWRSNRIRSYGA